MGGCGSGVAKSHPHPSKKFTPAPIMLTGGFSHPHPHPRVTRRVPGARWVWQPAAALEVDGNGGWRPAAALEVNCGGGWRPTGGFGGRASGRRVGDRRRSWPPRSGWPLGVGLAAAGGSADGVGDWGLGGCSPGRLAGGRLLCRSGTGSRDGESGPWGCGARGQTRKQDFVPEVRVLVGLGQIVEICYFTGPMGHPRVEIYTRPRPGILRVRVWVHPWVQFNTHTCTQWVWHPRAPAPTGRTAIPKSREDPPW
jgi:hypothetical protein